MRGGILRKTSSSFIIRDELCKSLLLQRLSNRHFKPRCDSISSPFFSARNFASILSAGNKYNEQLVSEETFMRLSEAIEKKGLASRNISRRFSSPYKFYQIEESDCCCAWCDGWCSSIYIFFHSNTTPRSDADAAASRHNNQALFNLLLRHAASSSSRGKRKYVFNRHTIFFGVQSQCSDGKGSLMMILLFFTLREEILVRAQIFFFLFVPATVLTGDEEHCFKWKFISFHLKEQSLSDFKPLCLAWVQINETRPLQQDDFKRVSSHKFSL